MVHRSGWSGLQGLAQLLEVDLRFLCLSKEALPRVLVDFAAALQGPMENVQDCIAHAIIGAAISQVTKKNGDEISLDAGLVNCFMADAGLRESRINKTLLQANVIRTHTNQLAQLPAIRGILVFLKQFGGLP
jgi:hypothetical protein